MHSKMSDRFSSPPPPDLVGAVSVYEGERKFVGSRGKCLGEGGEQY